MRKKKVLLTLAVVFVAAVVTVMVWPRERDPEYQGKKLSEWLAIAYGSPDPSQQVQASLSIREMGTNSLPYLIRQISWRPSRLRQKFYAMIGRFPDAVRRFATRIAGPDWMYRVRAAGCGFRALGPIAAPAVPKLVPVMNRTPLTNSMNQFVSLEVMHAIGGMGEPAIKPLLEVLGNEQHPHRARAVYCLARAYNTAGLEGLEVPVLLRCLLDKNPGVAETAVECLPKLGTREAIPVLADLARTNPALSVPAMYGLGLFGVGARPAVPVLVCALADTNVFIRESATNALWKIGPEVLETNRVTEPTFLSMRAEE